MTNLSFSPLKSRFPFFFPPSMAFSSSLVYPKQLQGNLKSYHLLSTIICYFFHRPKLSLIFFSDIIPNWELLYIEREARKQNRKVGLRNYPPKEKKLKNSPKLLTQESHLPHQELEFNQ